MQEDIDFVRAHSVAHAVALLQDGTDSRLLAGGQTLLAAMKLGLAVAVRRAVQAALGLAVPVAGRLA